MSTETNPRQASWLSNLVQSIGRAVRPAPTQMRGGAPKLQPISDILSRTGREPRAPE